MDMNVGYCESRMLNHCTNGKIKLFSFFSFSVFHISLIKEYCEAKEGIWYMWR